MMKMSPARDYMEMKIQSATPMELVLMLYEIGLESLQRALHSLDAGDIEGRTAAINRAQAVLGELQSALDFEKGGEVAELLRNYYVVAREQLIQAQMNQSHETLESVIADFTSLRDAWQEVARAVDGPAQTPRDTEPAGAVPLRETEVSSASGHWSA